jgi:hypothetical protein
MVYNLSLYITLNNYGYNNESIAQVKEYLKTRQLPNSLDNSGKKKRFLAKWECFRLLLFFFAIQKKEEVGESSVALRRLTGHYRINFKA